MTKLPTEYFHVHEICRKVFTTGELKASTKTGDKIMPIPNGANSSYSNAGVIYMDRHDTYSLIHIENNYS